MMIQILSIARLSDAKQKKNRKGDYEYERMFMGQFND